MEHFICDRFHIRIFTDELAGFIYEIQDSKCEVLDEYCAFTYEIIIIMLLSFILCRYIICYMYRMKLQMLFIFKFIYTHILKHFEAVYDS